MRDSETMVIAGVMADGCQCVNTENLATHKYNFTGLSACLIIQGIYFEILQ